MKELLDEKSIKSVLSEMLLYFKNYCEENGLRFYLCGGTLLGAIRHHGFIPWDDDIDLAMPRPDYEALLKTIQNHPLDRRYKIVAYENNDLKYPFMKLLDLSTTIESEYIKDDGTSSLWIDILPVDGMPSDKKELKLIQDKLFLLRKKLMLSMAKVGHGRSKIKSILKYFLVPYFRMRGAKNYCDQIMKIASKYPYSSSEYVGILTWGLYGEGERMRKTEFEKRCTVVFENSEYAAMSCWDTYLKGLYGDYMKLPPEDKRIHHDMVVWKEIEK